MNTEHTLVVHPNHVIIMDKQIRQTIWIPSLHQYNFLLIWNKIIRETKSKSRARRRFFNLESKFSNILSAWRSSCIKYKNTCLEWYNLKISNMVSYETSH